MEEKEYWAKRRTEETAKLKKAVGAAKEKRLIADINAFAKLHGWSEMMIVNKIIDARMKAFAEVTHG